MNFKSKISWPGQGDNLPTYKGEPPGKAAVRKAEMEAGGMKGIRRVDWKDAQGNSYTMNTRNGFPEVVSESGKKRSPLTPPFNSVRGWVAHVVDATVAALFSPYTLAVSDSSYKLFSTTYTILPFSTTFNVPFGDSTKWFDVLTFHKGTVKINGAVFDSLKYTGAPAKALPWLIPHTGYDVSKYGDSFVNASEKRIFSIERERVSILGGNPASAVLGRAGWRPAKALMCGAKIEPTLHKTWISQFAFSGSSWDAISSLWVFTSAHVSMLLTAPYLSKIDAEIAAEQPLCVAALIDASYTAGVYEAFPFPDAEIGITGNAVLGYSDTLQQHVVYPATGVYTHSVVGQSVGTKSGELYGATTSSTPSVLGKTVTVAASSSFSNLRYVTQATNDTQDIVVNPSPAPTYGTILCEPYTYPTLETGGIRGQSQIRVGGWTSGAVADYRKENSDAAFSIDIAGTVLVAGSATRYKEYGSQVKLTPVTWASTIVAGGWAYYTTVVAADAYYGMGDPRTDSAIAIMHDVAESFVGQGFLTRFDSTYENNAHYTSTTEPRTSLDGQTLNWTTKDFILFDETNGCYVSIDAVFAGAQAAGSSGVAGLTVNLNIVTPLGSTTQTLFTTTITYGELLPKIKTFDGYYDYVPAPQQRVIFTPLFQEQGDFKGAAYTTSAEVANGAMPAYLFNFVLTLDTYDAVGTDTSANPTINFIPCNLIEMLYAYVYSGKYGVDPYQRYPVDYPAVFSSFQASLFSNQWRVNYRNGTLVDWLDTLGGPYVAPTTTELYRT